MTVASQIKTAVASMKSAQASFEQFAIDTQNQEAKTLFTNAAQQTQKYHRPSNTPCSPD